MNILSIRVSKYKVLSIVLLLTYVRSLGQSNSQNLLTVTPPSPNVASLGKYGDIPVSPYTGIPDISIPLYTIEDGPLKLPISLSYHAGGVKVEEVSSSIGLGWTLNAGGVIGRNVRGLPDELSQWRNQPLANRIETIINSGNTYQLVQDISNGIKDGEADMYYYNFNGKSGKFFFDQAGTAYTQPLQNFSFSTLSDGWQIVTGDGTIYQFNKREEVNSAGCTGPDQITTTAWYLTSITSNDWKRQISFTYEQAFYTYSTLSGQVKYFWLNGSGGNCLQNSSPCLTSNNYRTHRLTRIDFGNGYVKFNYNTVRSDLVDDKSLDQIEIYTLANQLVTKFNFAHGYFGNNSDGVNRLTETTKRLKLNSVTEEGNDGTKKPPYQFQYNENIALPDRLSFSQDHWGYYNGQNNADLIASFTTASAAPPYQQVPFAGANRKANPATSQAGILTKITYPTGGETLFTFENNTVSDDRVEYQTTDQTISFNASNYLVRNLPSPYQSTELIIPAEGATVNFANISGLNTLWQGCDIVQCYVVKDNASSYYRQIGENLNGGSEFWPAGTYRLKLVTDCGFDAIANFNVTITANIAIPQTLAIRPVGGLRVLQSEDRPVTGNPIIKKYKYTKENDELHSSGVLINFPDYGYNLNVITGAVDEFGHLISQGYCNYMVRQSFSNYPLATTQGSYVGYGYVTLDLNGNGQTRYTYDVHEDVLGSFPFAPVENFDWQRGFLVKQEDVSIKNGQLVPVRLITNTPYGSNEKRVYGIKAGNNSLTLISGPVPVTQPFPAYTIYPTITQTFALGKATERIYDQNNVQLFNEKTTEYSYSPVHLQMVQSKTSTSRANAQTVEELVTNMKYPLDYVFTGQPVGADAQGIKKLQDAHIINAIVEQYQLRQTKNLSNNQISDQRIISDAVSVFRPDVPYANTLFRMDIASPLAANDFGSGTTITNHAFVKNPAPAVNNLYNAKILFNQYDAKGNVLEQQKLNNVKEVYLWGYNNQYPVAKITGADYSTVSAVISNQAALDNPVNDASLRYYLNTLRTDSRTRNALTFTYTYAPLIGITSETDPNGKTTYYEYDAFNRLKIIRDNDNNIIKKVCYTYAGVPGGCDPTVPAPPITCPVSMKQGYTSLSNNVSSYNGNTTFSLSFSSAAPLQLNTIYSVGNINGTCVPSKVSNIFTNSGAWRWWVVINPTGEITVQATSGPGPVSANTTVSFASLLYAQ